MLALPLLSTLLRPAAAQDDRVSAETPSRDTAILLLDAVWSDLPEQGVVVYLDCPTPDCAGQVPSWFELEGWAEGLDAGGLVRYGDSSLSPEILAQLQVTNHDRPPMMAMSLASRLNTTEAAALLYIYPQAREHRLHLSWEVYEMRSLTGPSRGRLILRPLPPPLPDPRADLIPWAQHRSVWVGAGLAVVGGAVVGATATAWSRGAEVKPAGTALYSAGWLSTMGGVTLMVLPLIQRN
ncbi:MAG: hypothetical protein ACI8RZ_007552 [Myxococcota bacterium]|jgi:hypothetical protein